MLPSVEVGDRITAGQILGDAQGLTDIYEGITEHYHFEVLMMIGNTKLFVDPEKYLNAL